MDRARVRVAVQLGDLPHTMNLAFFKMILPRPHVVGWLFGLCLGGLVLKSAANASEPTTAHAEKPTAPALKIAPAKTNSEAAKAPALIHANQTDSPLATAAPKPSTNGPVAESIPALAGTNQPVPVIPAGFDPVEVAELKQKLENSRFARMNRQGSAMTPVLVSLLGFGCSHSKSVKVLGPQNEVVSEHDRVSGWGTCADSNHLVWAFNRRGSGVHL